MKTKLINQSALARELGVKKQYLHQILRKQIPCPVDLALKIHEATKGIITADDLTINLNDMRRRLNG